jgi:hypothetical protein
MQSIIIIEHFSTPRGVLSRDKRQLTVAAQYSVNPYGSAIVHVYRAVPFNYQGIEPTVKQIIADLTVYEQ